MEAGLVPSDGGAGQVWDGYEEGGVGWCEGGRVGDAELSKDEEGAYCGKEDKG